MKQCNKLIFAGLLIISLLILAFILFRTVYEKYEADNTCNPSGGCSWDKCKTCSPGYCSQSTDNCKECGGYDPEKTWCVNGKPEPFPPPPPPPPCGQSPITNLKKAVPPPSVIGYYGNAETNPGGLLISEIPPIYNLLYITFLEFDTNAIFFLVIQGQYSSWNKGKTGLINDIKAWKAKPDPWGRNKKVFVSIGGATFQPGNTINTDPPPAPIHVVPPTKNGLYPTDIQLFSGLQKFLKDYDNIFDGIDIDMENTSRQIMVGTKRKTWESFFRQITTKLPSLEISACPEAANESLSSYEFMVPYLTSYNIQFYNNGPNAVSIYDVSWETFAEEQKARGNPNWDGMPDAWLALNTEGVPAWYWVLARISEYFKSHKTTFNPLIPASIDAAEQFNCYDYSKFAKWVQQGGVSLLGCWCIEQDVAGGNKFGNAIKKILNG